MTAGILGVGVERPDLHAGYALREQVLGEFVGAVQKGVEVFVGTFGFREPPVAHLLPRRLAHVAVAGAGVVGADPLPTGSAQELVDGLTRSLAEEIPQRYVQGRVAPRLGPAATISEVAVELAGVPVDVEGVLPEQVGSHGLVDVGLERPRREEGLAEAPEPLVRVNLDEQDIGELVEAERVNLDNPHRSNPRSDSHLVRPGEPVCPIIHQQMEEKPKKGRRGGWPARRTSIRHNKQWWIARATRVGRANNRLGGKRT